MNYLNSKKPITGILSYLILSYLISSCSIDDLKGKCISLALPINELQQQTTTLPLFSKESSQKNKLFYIASGDCSICVAKLLAFNDLVLHNRERFGDVEFFAILTSSSKLQLEFNIEKIIEATGTELLFPIYIDTEEHFSRVNPFIEKSYDLFLLDKDNRILFYGYPFKNEKDMKRLYKVIKRMDDQRSGN